jgi:predicted nucleic acid-binding protein
MILPAIPECVERFRARVLDNPSIVQDLTPEALDNVKNLGDTMLGLYLLTPFFHVTHGSQLPNILEEGLRPEHSPIDDEGIELISRLFNLYGKNKLSDKDRFESHILGQADVINRRIWVSSSPDDIYAVPERLQFFMRNLHNLCSDPRLSIDDLDICIAALARHREPLETNNTVATLAIDQLAPAILNHRLGNCNLSTFEGEARVPMSLLAGVNFKLFEPIAPEYLSIFDQKPVAADFIAKTILRPGQIFF